MTQMLSFADLVSLVPPMHFKDPTLMEHLPINNGGGQGYGWLLYKTFFKKTPSLIIRGKLLDRAHVFVNGRLRGIGSYWVNLQEAFNVPFPENFLSANNNSIEILIENMGRINYEAIDDGLRLLQAQRKGLEGSVFYPDGQALTEWAHVPLEFSEAFFSTLQSSAKWQPIPQPPLPHLPSVFRGAFQVDTDQPYDTFLDYKRWGRGVVFVNGFHLGRYSTQGPQKTLYVPRPVLKLGSNEVIIFEVDASPSDLHMQLVERPDLG
jgi:beta-galactosidase